MKDAKKLVLFFEYFSYEHIGKDPFLVPYYLGRELGCTVTIVYPIKDDNADMPSIINGVNLVPIQLRGDEGSNYRRRYFEFYKFLWTNAKKIDYVMKFFADEISQEMSILYKIRNPKGKFYIKMDINPSLIPDSSTSFLQGNLIKRCIKCLIHFISLRCIDVISCETTWAYDKLVCSDDCFSNWGDKLVMMPNGFDENLMEEYKIEERVFAKKENLMITVGRLGTRPKNTSMLLKALEKVYMKDWKFYLIGPIEESFRNYIELFYARNPDKTTNVIFTGQIYDKKQLWEFYNRSKVFVLTSEWESFGLVLVEAKRFKNFLITTPVGAAFDLTEDGHYGKIIPINDSDVLASSIQDIVDGINNIDVYSDFDCDSLSYKRMVRIVAEKLEKL